MKPIEWTTVKNFEDITYKKANGVARIAFNRPEVRNAFRPKTTSELLEAFHDAQEDTSVAWSCYQPKGLLQKMGSTVFVLAETKVLEARKDMLVATATID